MNDPTPSKYEVCEACKVERTLGHYERAIRCTTCGGTGLVPSPALDICNLCGESLHPEGVPQDECGPLGLVRAQVVGSYHSEGLLDLCRYTFSVCEKCLRKLFLRCTLPPEVESLTFRQDFDGSLEGEPWSFEQDQRAWEYQEFRRDGGHAATFAQGLCNAVKGCGKAAVWRIVLSEQPTDDCACDEHRGVWRNCMNAALIPFASPNETGEQVADAADEPM